MESLWKPGVHGIVEYAPILQTIALSACFLALFAFLIDHVDLLLRTWPVRKLHRVCGQTLLQARFRRKLSGVELEDALRRAYYLCTKRGKAFATKADLENWIIMLPLKSMKEWCNLPASHLSFMNYVENASAIGYHTNADCQTHINSILAYNQKRHFDYLHSLALKDTSELLPSMIGNPNSKEWVKFNPQFTASNLMMHFATSLVLGTQFSRDPDLMEHITAHVLGIEDVVNEFDRCPRFLWPLLWRLSSTHRNFRSNFSIIKKKVIPEIKRRIKLLRYGDKAEGDSTMLTIFLKQALKEGLISQVENSKSEEKDIDSLFMKTLFHIYEVWGPITPVLGAMFTRCMANPEYADALREEISDSLASHGGWDSDFLAHTPKLESFLRESLRLYAPISISVSRRLAKPLKLESMNMDLAKGTCIGVPTRCIHTDPANYPDPMAFNPYRFYDPATNTCSPRASTASETFLAFSYGTGLCPGRFIGVKVCELMLAKILLNYDVKYVSENQEFPTIVLMENTWSWLDTDFTAHIRRRQQGLA
ncbi:hypothetical protein MauCBS54593_002050 [Microsporum audouinii]